MTYRNLWIQGEKALHVAGIKEAKLDAWYLLEFVTGFRRIEFFSREQEEVPQQILTSYQKQIEKRACRIPLQQLIGNQEFMGLEFLIDENVLIPRQETELLVEQCGKICKGKRVLDLCTGSGCIIISLKKLYGVSEAVAVDCSKEALAVAKKNGERLGTFVQWLNGDLFAPVEGRFDIIVSNPPYIEHEKIRFLMPEVRDHEPVLALDGGEDGLDFYRRILKDAGNYLVSGGYLFFEIGSNQAKAIEELFKKYGYEHIQIKKDYAGLDRIVYAKSKN